jgi:hypothetical protein
MKTKELKTALYQTIENIDDVEFLKAILKIMSTKSNEVEYALSDKDWAEIERRQKLHKAGKSKSYTMDEVKKIVKAKIKK